MPHKLIITSIDNVQVALYYVNLMACEARRAEYTISLHSGHENTIYYKTLCIENRLIDFYSKHYLVNDQMVNLTNLDGMKSTFGKQNLKPSFC